MLAETIMKSKHFKDFHTVKFNLDAFVHTPKQLSEYIVLLTEDLGIDNTCVAPSKSKCGAKMIFRDCIEWKDQGIFFSALDLECTAIKFINAYWSIY